MLLRLSEAAGGPLWLLTLPNDIIRGKVLTGLRDIRIGFILGCQGREETELWGPGGVRLGCQPAPSFLRIYVKVSECQQRRAALLTSENAA
jgi:hypothetical protein